MGVRDVSGVLSRYFVLGFFVPSFFALFTLSQLLTSAFLPQPYERLRTQDQVLVLGAGALFLGLVLLGLRYPITRMLEGYPLERAPARLRRPFVWLQERSYDRLKEIQDDPKKPDARRIAARRLLDRRFHKDRGRLLGTRFGNAIRASENYSFTRWGLDGVAAWPRIEPLLSEQEQELHAHANSDFSFFEHATLGSFAVGLVLIADAIVNHPLAHRWDWAYVAPFAFGYAMYRAAVGAAERRGTERRASIDLHRRELYERLGVRQPASFTEERERIGPAVSSCLLYGTALDDAYAAPPAPGGRGGTP